MAKEPTHSDLNQNIQANGKVTIDVKDALLGKARGKSYLQDPNGIPQTAKVQDEKNKEQKEASRNLSLLPFFKEIKDLLKKIEESIKNIKESTSNKGSTNLGTPDNLNSLAEKLTTLLKSKILDKKPLDEFFLNIKKIANNLDKAENNANTLDKIVKFFNIKNDNKTILDFISDKIEKIDLNDALIDKIEIKDTDKISKLIQDSLIKIFQSIKIDDNIKIDTTTINNAIINSLNTSIKEIDLNKILNDKIVFDSTEYQTLINQQISGLFETVNTKLSNVRYGSIVTTINNKLDKLTFKLIDLSLKIKVKDIDFSSLEQSLKLLSEKLASINIPKDITLSGPPQQFEKESGLSVDGTKTVGKDLFQAIIDSLPNPSDFDKIKQQMEDIKNELNKLWDERDNQIRKTEDQNLSVGEKPIDPLEVMLNSIANKISLHITEINDTLNKNSLRSEIFFTDLKNKIDASIEQKLGKNGENVKDISKNILDMSDKIYEKMVGKSDTTFKAEKSALLPTSSVPGTSPSAAIEFKEADVKQWNDSLREVNTYLTEDEAKPKKITDEEVDKIQKLLLNLLTYQNNLLGETSTFSDTIGSKFKTIFDNLIANNINAVDTNKFHERENATGISRADLDSAYNALFDAIDLYNSHSFNELEKIKLERASSSISDEDLLTQYKLALKSLQSGVTTSRNPFINKPKNANEERRLKFNYYKDRAKNTLQGSTKVPKVLSLATTTPETFNLRNFLTNFGVYSNLELVLANTLGKKLNKINKGIGGLAIGGGEEGTGLGGKGGLSDLDIGKLVGGKGEGGKGPDIAGLIGKLSGKGGGLGVGDIAKLVGGKGGLTSLLGGGGHLLGGTGSILGAGGALGAAGALAGGALVAGVAAAGVHGAMNATKWDRLIGNVNNESLMPKWLGGTYADGALASINHYLGEGALSRIGSAWKSGKWSKLWGKNNLLDDDYTEAEHKALISLGKDKADQLQNKRQDKLILERVTNARENNIHYGFQQSINGMISGMLSSFNKSLTKNRDIANGNVKLDVSALSGMNSKQLLQVKEHGQRMTKMYGYSQRMISREANDLRDAYNIFEGLDDKAIDAGDRLSINKAYKNILNNKSENGEDNASYDLSFMPSIDLLKKVPDLNKLKTEELKEWQQKLINFSEAAIWKTHSAEIDAELLKAGLNSNLCDAFRRHFLTYHNKWLFLIVSDLIKAREGQVLGMRKNYDADALLKLGYYSAEGQLQNAPPEKASGNINLEKNSTILEDVSDNTSDIGKALGRVKDTNKPMYDLLNASIRPGESHKITYLQQNELNEWLSTNPDGQIIRNYIINYVTPNPVTIIKDWHKDGINYYGG